MTESGFQLAGSAPERYERFVAPIMAPFVAALVEASGLAEGQAVLDVACGTGFVARAAAARVGPRGRVVAVDVNPGMLAMAQAAAEGVSPAIEWHTAPAQAMPLDDAVFDATVCQQGMQFFPDLSAATRETARVTRAGGVLAATVWSPVERSPYFAAQGQAVAELLDKPAVASFAMAFGCPSGRLADAFSAAGCEDVRESEIVADITLGDVDSFAINHLYALPWGAELAGRGDDAVATAARLVVDALADFRTDDTITVPFASAIVTARAT